MIWFWIIATIYAFVMFGIFHNNLKKTILSTLLVMTLSLIIANYMYEIAHYQQNTLLSSPVVENEREKEWGND